jgi:preprotein translocase subunit SecF
MEFLKNPNYNFFGKTKYFVALSLAIIIGGIISMNRQGIHYGVEFSGGTQLVVRFEKRPQVDKIRAAAWAVSPGATIQIYDVPTKNQVLIRIATTNEEDLSKPVNAVLKSLADNYPQNPVKDSSSETVGPIVGAELRHKAIQLTVLGLLFQLIYIGVRFKGAIWGAAAAIAVFHDVLATLAFLSFTHYEISLNVIAALLTLVGYSVNDTIVIFDRARENLRHQRKDSLSKLLNDSINQTLTRTLITSGTTFLALMALYLFGGEALRGFSFSMVVGVIVGTYSTIYIASPIVLAWERLRARRARAA